MNPETATNHESRLRKLERQNRILISTLLLGVVLAACTSGMTGKQSAFANSEVRAGRFILVDSENREIGTWTSVDGYASLTFDRDRRLGRYGRSAVRLQEEKDGAMLEVVSNSGDYAKLSVDDREQSMLDLVRNYPAGSTSHVLLKAAASPTLMITAGDQSRVSLKTGDSRILTYSDHEKVARFTVLEDSVVLRNARMNFLDRAGGPLLTLPANP
jgi:hypothetical protein